MEMLEREKLTTLVISRWGVHSVGVNHHESSGSAVSGGWLLCMKYGGFCQLFVSTILKPLALLLSFFFFFFNNNYCMIYNVTALTALQPCESLAYLGQCFALCSQEMAVGSERTRVHMGSRWCWCCFHKSCLGGRGEKQFTLITGMTCWMLVPGVSASEHN